MWLIIITMFLFLYFFNQSIKRPIGYPPGPPLLPFLGNLISVWVNVKKLKYRHKVWQKWSREYGSLVGLRLGSINVVIVSGKDYIKEVSSREVFEGRPDGFFYLMRSFGKKMGIVFSDGSFGNKTRRSVLKYLKDYGYGSRAIETNVKEECQALIELLKSMAEQPVTVNNIFDVSIVNILWRIVAGKRYDLTDNGLKTLCDFITKSFKVVDMSGGLLNFMPLLRHVIPDLLGYTELKNIHNLLHAFLKETIEEHRCSIDIKKPRDVIDALLIDMIYQKDEAFTNEELQVVCLDLLEAGVETVSNTVVFLLLYIVREREVQSRLHMEIDKEIGQSRPPKLSDRSRLVYTEAVLLETLRISTVAAMGIPHMAIENTRLGNYIIPKGTFLLLAFYDLHNGRHWKDPETFRPERFLTKEGNLIQDEWLMPFGTGRRRCIGEGLARAELFMFLTHILQKFELRLPDDDPLPSVEPVDGVSLSPKEFRIIFKLRFNEVSCCKRWET